ncbi:MAG: hypothetical protein KJ799_17700 [Bacteroidetes bacterium]|nr:hypothetical protein [Bacteroidota bacterium]MBU1680434.1 hypothetical protein [Bacteroidota bacterium]MBU2508533.1 hypothetical protein [Bacteroidota bacterium]
MELIPILSLIILVATISTFILAVGAYILYKIREKNVASSSQPSSIPAELVAPMPLMAEQTATRRTVYEDRMTRPTYATAPQMQPTYASAPTSYAETSKFERTVERAPAQAERYSGPQKFMRYTNEGYGEQKQQKEVKKEEGLRWR